MLTMCALSGMARAIHKNLHFLTTCKPDFVGQVGNLPPIVNRRAGASDNPPWSDDFPDSAAGRLPIGRRLPTCPTILILQYVRAALFAAVRKLPEESPAPVWKKTSR